MDKEKQECYTEGEKRRKEYETLTISNDFMFFKVMQESDICKKFLEIVLGIEISKIVYVEAQKTIDVSKDAKSVRLDVYVKDEKKTVYNIEMQTTKNKNLQRRSRYYQSISDTDQIGKGENYLKLKQHIVIFICNFDLFGKGIAKYSFKNRCKEVPEMELNDGTEKIFININGDTDDMELKDLIVYIRDSVVSETGKISSFLQQLDSAVDFARKNADWRREYMMLAARDADMQDECRRKIGFKTVQNMLRESNISLEKACRWAQITVDEYNEQKELDN